jgi:hypothetical protein
MNEEKVDILEKMRSIYLTFLVIVSTCNPTVQQPTFFRSTFKGLNGFSPKTHTNDEIKAVYYYEQTVAVVDLGPQNELHDCNIIEV